MSQYKYYFKKPKGEITKDILTWFMIGGAIAIASTSPYFATNLLRAFPNKKRYKRKELYNRFYQLRKAGLLDIQRKNKQMYVFLTEEGKRKAGRFQINSLQITKPQKWDGKWRILMFDIEEQHRIKREALRGILKQLQLHQLQKSVWIHPFDCKDEVDLLRDFFGFTSQEVKLIVAENIGKDEQPLRKVFGLS